jgi:L-cysteine desulfidase
MNIETILRRTLKPALGCTEPVAVALAVSAAVQATANWTPDAEKGCTPLKGLEPDAVVSLRLLVNNNIFKNAFAIYIPNAEGHKGIRMAAALGIWCDPGLGLGLFRDIGGPEVARALRLIQEGKVSIDIVPADHTALYVEARVKIRQGTAVHEGAALIQDEHTNLVLLRNDGREVFRRIAAPLPGKDPDDRSGNFTHLGFGDLVSLADNLPATAYPLLEKTIELNLKAAETGLEQPLGLGVGYYGTRLPGIRGNKNDLVSGAAAGSDARMSGYPVEVMSSAGSGNQGIIGTVPVFTYCRMNGIDDTRMLRAVALSHVVTMYVTSHLGYLSTLCGVAVKAGIGAACGITYAMGGREAQIGLAVKIMAATLSGVICDGAKLGCALKVSSAADMAVRAASMAMNGMDVSDENGIVADTPEKTIRNLARLNQSMRAVEDRIVEIMREKIVQKLE